MGVELVDPLSDPEPSGWRDLHRDEGLTAPWSYDVIREAAGSARAGVLPALLHDDGRPCGIAIGLYLGLGRGRRPRPRREPVLLDVRVPGYSHGPGWHFASWVPLERRRLLLRDYERAVLAWLGKGCAGLVYRGMTAADLPVVARRAAFTQAAATSGSMPVTWSSAEEWLGSLRASRRKDLRRQRRIVARSEDLEVEIGAGRADLGPEEHAEMARLHDDHELRLKSMWEPHVPLPASYFAALHGRPDVVTATYRERQGRLLAFGALLDHPTHPKLGSWAAVDPGEGGRKHLYFYHYLRLIDHVAGSGGRRELSAGQGMFEVKGSLGFQPVPMWRVVVPRWAAGRTA
ncbi:hypothetical protein GCM10009555_008520 [Acrocarpospora macrocephala]|uniref:BioF2-like acetyltransferase domain-containing protein n=1 Tax=Acrocarpospora macrocephala TaxID=150177 RepID=A0A5M3WZE4_9ACTN|nr:GNAT family N-acetyltransferase [Acrocarpospora macrocephala]GES14865.1 hypothetical protein Amac_084620 [Acrocarpospora macrocephala]